MQPELKRLLQMDLLQAFWERLWEALLQLLPVCSTQKDLQLISWERAWALQTLKLEYWLRKDSWLASLQLVWA